MLGKSHLFYGTTAGAILALALAHPPHAWLLAEAAVAGGIGGLLPDLDEPGSTISNAPRILGRVARRLRRRPTRHTPLRLLGTRPGIPLVPSTAARLHLLPPRLRIRTGSVGETVFTATYSVALVAVVYIFLAQEVTVLLRSAPG